MHKISHASRESRYFSNWGYIKLDIFDIASDQTELFSNDFSSIIECLQKKGFNNSVEELAIDYENWDEIEYGNYNLKKIKISNFRQLEYSDSIESIKNYIYFTDELITGSLSAAPSYYKYFNEIFIPHLSDCGFVFELITEKKLTSKLLLSWGGRYEHFKTFIFICPNSNAIKHLEMGRD
jgi:hypothetical protein